ncbi:MAG: CHAD domain-containing protein [Gammaproteobacteria bacterium]
MPPPAYHVYDVTGQEQAETVLSFLREHYAVESHEIRRWQRRLLDTFDWRLYRDGGVLEQFPAADGTRVLWRNLDSMRVRGQLIIPRPPRFASDLPAGTFRDALESVTEMRALLPVATVRGTAQQVNLADASGKQVLRLVLERPARSATCRLLLFPVKGYDRDLKRARRLLEQSGLVRNTTEPLRESLAAEGRVPGDYTGKLRLALDPDMRADAATRCILSQLLDGMLANEAGLREDIDSEFLHDFRVAVRRTRSALGQIKGVLAARTVQRFEREFAWLGRITGPTRDLDVYLLQFDHYRAHLPRSMQSDLDPLRTFLEHQQRLEHRALVSTLDGARYRRLVRDWRRFLQTPLARRPSAPHARSPIKQVAAHRIQRLHRRALKQGRAITADTPTEALHELRKTCKKLRYLLEFFRSLYPEETLGRLLTALKQLQDNLGELQDLEVQTEALTRFEDLMERERQLNAGTRAAMDWLVESFQARKQDVRRQFARRFAAFNRPAVARLFHNLFNAHPRGQANHP